MITTTPSPAIAAGFILNSKAVSQMCAGCNSKRRKDKSRSCRKIFPSQQVLTPEFPPMNALVRNASRAAAELRSGISRRDSRHRQFDRQKSPTSARKASRNVAHGEYHGTVSFSLAASCCDQNCVIQICIPARFDFINHTAIFFPQKFHAIILETVSRDAAFGHGVHRFCGNKKTAAVVFGGIVTFKINFFAAAFPVADNFSTD